MSVIALCLFSVMVCNAMFCLVLYHLVFSGKEQNSNMCSVFLFHLNEKCECRIKFAGFTLTLSCKSFSLLRTAILT